MAETMGRIEKMDLFSHSTELAYTVSEVTLDGHITILLSLRVAWGLLIGCATPSPPCSLNKYY